MTTETREPPFESWAVLELLGHRRLGGLVREVTLAGAAMLRIDVPGEGDTIHCTQFYPASSIYCLTPCGEAEARAVARSNRPQPVTRWEMTPALPHHPPAADEDVEDDWDDGEPQGF